MTISNWDQAKKKFKTGIPIFLITAGFIFLITAVIAFWNGSIDYRIQLEQKKWPITNATVSSAEAKVKRSSGKYSHRTTYYDIHYDYMIDGQAYTGILEDQYRYKNIGDSFEIRYNPNAPEESTHILKPSKTFIVSGSISGGAGLILVTLSIILVKKNKKIHHG